MLLVRDDEVCALQSSWIDGAGVLTGWNRLGIPTDTAHSDHPSEQSVRRRGAAIGAARFFGPLGGRKHELVARDFLR